MPRVNESQFFPVMKFLTSGEHIHVFDHTHGPQVMPQGFRYGIGRYLEKRQGMYVADLFAGSRNIHMGLDLGAPEGEEVFAFTQGRVLFQGYNSAVGDYGAVIVTEHSVHRLDNGSLLPLGKGSPGKVTPLYALWGHLSLKSLELRTVGSEFSRGERLGFLGDKSENGGWPSHLHLQLSWKKPTTHDMPGAVSENDLARAKSIYPDPELVLGLEGRLYER